MKVGAAASPLAPDNHRAAPQLLIGGLLYGGKVGKREKALGCSQTVSGGHTCGKECAGESERQVVNEQLDHPRFTGRKPLGDQQPVGRLVRWISTQFQATQNNAAS